jgi:DNA-binding NarL/FixJ family response regulator
MTVSGVEFCEPLQHVANVESAASIAIERLAEAPGVDRREGLRRLDELANQARALALKGNSPQASVRDALAAALDAYFAAAKRIVERELAEPAERSHRSRGGLSAEDFAPEPKLDLRLLSPAETTVFRQLVKGKPNKIIAWELSLSEATVKAHVSKILKKLKVRNRGHAIALCLNPERVAG